MTDIVLEPGHQIDGRFRSVVMKNGARIPQVALLLETSTEYGRGLLRGILRYSRLHGPWSLHVAPGHLDQVLPPDRSWSGTGIIGRIRSPEMERMIQSYRIPIVASSLGESRRLFAGGPFGEICTNSGAIAVTGASHLLDTGVRRLAFCGFENCHWSTVRERAFARLAKDVGLPCWTHRITLSTWMQRPNWIIRWEHEQPIIIRWLRSLPKPVGLMACNDVCGREVLQACAAAGLRVPDEVAVVGVDNDEMMCELASPPLSSVALDLERAGYEAARLLDDLMSGSAESGQVLHVEPTHVVSRRSSDVIVREDPVVSGALRFIRDHAGQAISVADVSDELRVSRRTLERRFLHSVGRTVLAEITRCHLKRAKQLLVETDLPCHRIAAGAGFGSLETFNRAFLRSEKTSPGKFRMRSKPPARAPAPTRVGPIGPLGVRALPPEALERPRRA